ncbi:alpha/beta hydrolase [Halobacillus litoralis]|uniref:alpha/beta hydrolase n=1 Tax=Halobacillus litoralis TaxID=45668 RepID=UPI00249192DF|nr:alpha/beta hydrolase [Halobacillus litoralis]
MPAIFLPAGGFTGNEGLNIAEFLSGDFETHLIDLPGLGNSKGIDGKITSVHLANWVKEYMEQNHIEKADLIGHSLGGAILLSFAVHYPDKVNKLVLLDQGHKPFPRIPKSEFGPFAYIFPLINVCVKIFRKPCLNKLAPLFLQGNEQEIDFEGDVKRFCERMGIEENEYVRMAIKHPAEFSVEGLNLMFGYYNLNLPKLLKSIKVPTYLIYGTFENINEKEHRHTEHYIQKLKRHSLPITYHQVNGGHYVHWNKEFSLYDLKEFLTNTS